MASILVSDLKVAGLDLFNNQETYLTEVVDDELGLTYGGISPITSVSPTTPKIGVGIGIGARFATSFIASFTFVRRR